MRPAYHIPLSARERGLIGELCAIQAQIEWSMFAAVTLLLDLGPDASQRIMGSTSIGTNADIWLRVVRAKHPLEDAKAWAEYGFKEIADMAQGRNDFVHALYLVDTADLTKLHKHPLKAALVRSPREASVYNRLGLPPTAMRVRNMSFRPVSELPTLCEKAARLSIITAFVAESCRSGASLATWRRRLGSRLPPQPQTARAQKATKPRGQPAP